MPAFKPIVFGSSTTTSTDVADVRVDILKEFRIKAELLAPYEVLVWFYPYEDYSGDSYLLLRHKVSRELYLNEAGHCPCYGLKDTFSPTRTHAKVELARLATAHRMPFVVESSYARPDARDVAAHKLFVKVLTRLAKGEKVEG